jgi:hypothetical protein
MPIEHLAIPIRQDLHEACPKYVVLDGASCVLTGADVPNPRQHAQLGRHQCLEAI